MKPPFDSRTVPPDRAGEAARPADAVRAYVAAHAEALRARGFTSLALFGSFARGEAGPESDVDVLYAFAPGRASLGAVLDVQEALAGLTGRSVQVVSRRHLHPLLRERILREAEPLLGDPAPEGG